MRVRKKPVVVEAVMFVEHNAEDVATWCGGRVSKEPTPSNPNDVRTILMIPTLEGVMIAQVGDWIIEGVKGEFYPCKPEIFNETYEFVAAPKLLPIDDLANE